MKHQSLVQVAVALLCGSAAVAHAQNSGHSRGPRTVTPISLSVTSQPIAAALNDFARQSGLHVVIGSEVAAGVQSTLVDGTFTPEAALKELLRETGLRYEYLDSETVAVFGTDESRAEVRGGETIWRFARLNAALSDSAAGGAGPVQTNDGESNLEENSTKNSMLEEVVVTAQKREERLQDVPISISVLNGEALDRSTFISVNDALRSVPGVAVYGTNSQTGMTRLNIRGVSSNVSFLNSGSPVGYYIDEVPFAFVRYPFVPDAGAYDIERVEVLRGPQGTLYGAGSLNGVVRILTQDADLNETEFKARTTVSSVADGGDSYRGDAALSVPIVPGKLAVRGVLGYADNAGWVDKPPTGLKDSNSGVQKNGRLKVNAAPVENLGVGFSASFYRDDRDASPNSRDDRTVLISIPESLDTEYDTYGLTLTYDFPGASLLSATNYIDLSSATILGIVAGSTDPLDAVDTRVGAKLISQEFRLASTMNGPWRWTAGAIYRDEEDTHYFNFLSPAVDNAFPTLAGIARNIFASKSIAVFGELTRMFFDDKLELMGGLRYFKDKTSSNELTSVSLLAVPYGFKEETYDAVTPRVVLTYKPTDHMNYYASYSQGFRSGFAQAGSVLALTAGAAPQVDPDKLTNYEIGAKGSLFDGRISYELAAYYIDWKDTVQVVTTVIGPAAVNTAINTEGVAGAGVDAATTIKVTDRLDVGATFSWNNLGFVDDVITLVNNNPTVLYPKDGRTPSSSETTVGANIGYTISLPGQYSGRLSGSVNYASKMLTAAATTAAATEGDNITTVNGSFTLQAHAGWSAMLFVDNLTDEDGRVTPASPANPLAGAEHLRPRTYGLQLDYRFN